MFRDSNKIFAIVFFVLLFVVVGEILYLFFFSKPKVNQVKIDSPQPTFGGNSAINSSNITYLQGMPPDTKWKNYLSQSVTGIVANYKISGDSYSFDLVNENDKSIVESFNAKLGKVPKYPVKNYIQTGDNLSSTSEDIYGNLKEGDKIKILRLFDLGLPRGNNFIQNEIILYK